MPKYKSACASLRPGQLDRVMAKVKDRSPLPDPREIETEAKKSVCAECPGRIYLHCGDDCDALAGEMERIKEV